MDNYTHAECIGKWDLEVFDEHIASMREEILSQKNDNINYAVLIGKWDDEIK